MTVVETDEVRLACTTFSRDWPVMVALVLVVPCAAIAVRMLMRRYFAASDLALIEIRVRDVGGAHTPLVGPYSRYGWNHPGPLLFYALALPYRVFGSTSSGLLAAAVLLNLVAAIGCAWVLWRRGHVLGLAVGGTVLLVLVRSLASETLMSPWNPHAIVLPMLLLALVVWSVMCGDDWMLPIAVGVGSFCVQSHVGSAGAVAVLLAIAVAAFLFHIWRKSSRHALRTTVIAVVVGIACWIPPAIDQLNGSGNLSDLWRYWSSPHEHLTGWARAARIVASQMAIPAPWMTTHERTAPFAGGLLPQWQIPWALILLCGAGVVAWRRQDRTSLSLVAIAATLAAVAWVSAARVVDEPYSYLLRWTWVIGAIAWLAIGWTAMSVLSKSPLRSRLARPAAYALTIAAIMLAAATTVTGLRARPPFWRTNSALQHLAPAVTRAARQSPMPLLIDSAPNLESASLADGILLELNRQGIDAKKNEDSGIRGAGRHHTISRRDARTTILVAANDAIDTYSVNPAFRLITSYDVLTTTERAFVRHQTAQLEHDVGSGGTLADVQAWANQHLRDWKRLNELNARGDRDAIFISVPNP